MQKINSSKLFLIFFFCITIISCSSNISNNTGERLNVPFTANRIVDLTHTMSEDMPFWPGGVPFKMERLADYSDGYRLHKFTFGENTGTHIDAPSHFIEGNNSIDSLPLSSLVAPIVCIDIREKATKNADYELTVEDVNEWETQNGRIPKNSLVILNTGWHNKFSNSKEYINMDKNKVMHFPGYSSNAAEILIKRNVIGIGIDTLSLDNGVSKTFSTHVAMLKANKYQIENMANLSSLPAKGATAVIGVLPVKEGSQAQARIFAFL